VIKKVLRPFAGVLEQITNDVFTSAHGFLNKVNACIEGFTDDLWAGDEDDE
jgi:hypothetical protein